MTEQKSNNTPDNAAKKTILVVDDNEMVCLLVKSILQSQYEIVSKNDGEDAFQYIKEGNRPDLILLDMIMPKMNGRTFARKIHSDPRYTGIPVIFITTVDSTMLINSFKAMGVIDFIIKPFVNDDLIKKVNEVLQPA